MPKVVYLTRIPSLFLYSLLFSLYINGLADELKKSSCRVDLSVVEKVIPGRLLADDTSLFASDESDIKNSLDVQSRWCNEWGLKINVHKSGIMHIRQKKMKRADVQYVIDMVERKTVAGKKTSGARFSQCKVEVGT